MLETCGPSFGSPGDGNAPDTRSLSLIVVIPADMRGPGGGLRSGPPDWRGSRGYLRSIPVRLGITGGGGGGTADCDDYGDPRGSDRVSPADWESRGGVPQVGHPALKMGSSLVAPGADISMPGPTVCVVDLLR